MYESYGNVAYRLPDKSSIVKKQVEHDRQYRRRHRADPKRVVCKTQSEEERIAVSLHRQMAKARIGRIFACVCVVSLLTATFAGILYRSSKILEMNYANVTLEREIKLLETQENQIKEELAKKTDLTLIRAMAVEKLGMQDPGQKQIVQVNIPRGDRVVIENVNGGTQEGDTRLSSALNNIEGFFKTIR